MGTPTQLQIDIAVAGRIQRTGRKTEYPHVWEARLHAVAALVRQAFARWEQRRRAADTCRALEQLDARTLRDLGIHRSEISSLAAEVACNAEATRIRAVRAPASGRRCINLPVSFASVVCRKYLAEIADRHAER
jgi:uncharacterized protein YjiS (DUF1127 family)